MITKEMNICIVGLGLLGGSYAQRLSELGYHVSAHDINQASLDHGLAKGMIEEGSTDPKIVAKADLVIFGLYPSTLISWLQRYQHLLPTNCICSDVSGIKEKLISEINTFIRPDIRFVFAHPMAGKEVSGVFNSDPTIFEQANFIIIENKDSTAQQTIAQLAKLLGFAHISYLDAKSHDEMIAFVSQLTHVIAVCLMNTNDNTKLKDYTGDSFRDLTRIAKINEDLWYELFKENKTRLLQQISDFEAALADFTQALAGDDEAKLKALFRQSTKRRKEFDKK
ncbi:MAG: prephenate dehydrogenase [Erysipelotrichaceae bacterium]|nr:prephenate dehydrogenase [Erysipelotrichaceae bacterium]MDY5252629.1 prephenate dehydrogenase [Erysipelotrichaceae bacterium]